MIDSSKWSVIEAGLQCVQGKAVVNSISLKEGEEPSSSRHAAARAGATAPRSSSWRSTSRARPTPSSARSRSPSAPTTCSREKAGFAPEDIILDPNIFAIGTGIEEHANYAVAFIEATRRIKAELPGARVSGGVSNVSFAFRGNDPVREAIHSRVPVPRDRAPGWTWASSTPASCAIYDDIDPELRELVEDVVLNRRPDATERLLAVADSVRRAGGAADAAATPWPGASGRSSERLTHALVEGIDAFIVEDTEEARPGRDPAASRSSRAR